MIRYQIHSIGTDTAEGAPYTSPKNISLQAESLSQRGHASSQPSKTSWCQITPCPDAIPLVALHISFRLLFHHYFSLCLSPTSNKHTSIVAKCNHMSEWVHWVRTCIRIAMQWVTLPKTFLTFLHPACKLQFSHYSLYTSFKVVRTMGLLTIHCSIKPSPVLQQVVIS